jgi:Eukaryotic glutathione synthase, ATP binding domain.
MSASISPDYPPRLTLEQQEYLVSHLEDWSITHGLTMRPSPALVDDVMGTLAAVAPVTLFPSPFPRHCFEEAISIQPAYNELYSAISRDEEWLGGVVEEYGSQSRIH